MPSDAASAPRRSRELGKKLALAAASVALAAGLLESSARIFLPLPAPFQRRDGLYLNALPLVNRRPTGGRTRWTMDGPPLSERKQDGEVRVFVFGDSNALGMPWGPLMGAPAFLRERLAASAAAGKVTVVNMALGNALPLDAYYYLIASRKYRPDFIIFYFGTEGRYDFESETCLPANHPRAGAAWRFLVERSRFFLWLRVMAPEAVLSWQAQPGGRPPLYVSRRKDACEPLPAFKLWADLLVRTAAATGARVIVNAPAQNSLLHLESPQEGSSTPQEEFFAGLDPGARSLLRCRLSRGCDFVKTLQRAEAAGLRKGPASVERQVSLLGRVWEQAAARHGAAFVDFARAVQELSPGGWMGFPQLIDDTHLTPQGYWLLAGRWHAEVMKALRGPLWREDAPPAPPDFWHLPRDSGEPSLDDMLLDYAVLNLARKTPLLAVPMLEVSAREFGDAKAAVLLGWLRDKAGLASGLPAAQAAALKGLELSDYIPPTFPVPRDLFPKAKPDSGPLVYGLAAPGTGQPALGRLFREWLRPSAGMKPATARDLWRGASEAARAALSRRAPAPGPAERGPGSGAPPAPRAAPRADSGGDCGGREIEALRAAAPVGRDVLIADSRRGAAPAVTLLLKDGRCVCGLLSSYDAGRDTLQVRPMGPDGEPRAARAFRYEEVQALRLTHGRP